MRRPERSFMLDFVDLSDFLFPLFYILSDIVDSTGLIKDSILWFCNFLRERLSTTNFLNLTPMIFKFLSSKFLWTFIRIYFVRNGTKSCLLANFTGFWWTSQEVAWFYNHRVILRVSEVLRDMVSLLCVFVWRFISQPHNLWWTERFLMTSCVYFTHICLSRNGISDLLKRFTNSIERCFREQNWVNCCSFLHGWCNNLLRVNNYSTFCITASYKIFEIIIWL